MAINKQRVSDVFTYNRSLVYIHIVYIVNQVNAFTLTAVGRLDNPDVLLAFMLLQFLVVVVEISKLIRKNISVRCEIECLSSKLLLHSHNVKAHSVFASNLV